MKISVQKKSRPPYASTDLKTALATDWRSCHLSRKEDGICVRREFSGCTVWGDTMPDGRLMVWEIERAFGEDVRKLPWLNGRDAALTELFSRLNPKLNWIRCATGFGAEFIEAVITADGEGVVAKPFDAPFGVGLCKIKRQHTEDCVVLEIHPVKQSIRIGQFDANGALIERGWCPVLGGDGCGFWKNRRVDLLEIGDVVEIIAHRVHVSGKFREPRIATDAAGEIKIRRDKSAAACLASL